MINPLSKVSFYSIKVSETTSLILEVELISKTVTLRIDRKGLSPDFVFLDEAVDKAVAIAKKIEEATTLAKGACLRAEQES